MPRAPLHFWKYKLKIFFTSGGQGPLKLIFFFFLKLSTLLIEVETPSSFSLIFLSFCLHKEQKNLDLSELMLSLYITFFQRLKASLNKSIFLWNKFIKNFFNAIEYNLGFFTDFKVSIKSPLKLVKDCPLTNLRKSPKSLYLFIAFPRQIQKYFHKNNFNFCSLSFNKSKSNAFLGSKSINSFLSSSDKLFSEKLNLRKKLYFSTILLSSVFSPINVIGFIFDFEFSFFLL